MISSPEIFNFVAVVSGGKIMQFLWVLKRGMEKQMQALLRQEEFRGFVLRTAPGYPNKYVSLVLPLLYFDTFRIVPPIPDAWVTRVTLRTEVFKKQAQDPPPDGYFRFGRAEIKSTTVIKAYAGQVWRWQEVLVRAPTGEEVKEAFVRFKRGNIEITDRHPKAN